MADKVFRCWGERERERDLFSRTFGGPQARDIRYIITSPAHDHF